MITHYIKMALRQLMKYKFHTIISALCMALGLTINGYIGVIIELQFEPKEKMSLLCKNVGYMNGREYKEVSRQNVGLEKMQAISKNSKGAYLYCNDNKELPYLVGYRGVSTLFFRYDHDIRGNLMIEGRDSIGENEMLITKELATMMFGKESPIGKLVTLTNIDSNSSDNGYTGKKYLIVGITKQVYSNESSNSVYLPMQYNDDRYVVDAYLTNGFTKKEVQDAFDKVQFTASRDGKPFKVYVSPYNEYTPEFLTAVLLITIFSLLIFVTGLINFMRFIIQMFYSRWRELALRKCLGSNSRGLYMLLASEVVIMLTVSFLLSCITTELTSAYLRYINLNEFELIPLGYILAVQACTTLLALTVTLLVILIPIFKLRHASIKGSILRKRQGTKMRNTLIGVQFTVSIICLSFLAVAIVTDKNERSFHSENLTIKEQERIFCFHPMTRNWDEIRQEFEKLPEVENFVYCEREGFSMISYNYQELYIDNDTLYAHIIAYGDPRYFELFNIPMNGKMVTGEEENYIYIDKKLQQRLMQEENFDGTIKSFGEQKYSIAGTIEGDFFIDGQMAYVDYVGERPMAGAVFVVNNNNPQNFYYRIKEGVSVKEAREAFKSVIYKFFPKSIEVKVQTMKEKLELQYRANTMMKHLSYIMAGISIIVVVLSIYSTISLDAVTRQKDIAIRKINGANKRDIARHYLLPYLAIYGVTFAVVYPLLANLFLLSIDFNFGFTTNTIILCGAIQFIGTIILLMAVTWHKIMLIMHVNPAEVIRRE